MVCGRNDELDFPGYDSRFFILTSGAAVCGLKSIKMEKMPDTNANSYVYETLTVDSGTKMNVWLAPGGGIAMRLSPASRSGK